MSRLLSCNALVDHALREIGSFSSYDVSADATEHEIGLQRLDMLLAELAGTENLWFLHPTRQTVDIPVSEESFTLFGLLDPPIQFFEDTRLIVPEATDNERPLELVRRLEYDEIRKKNESGDPRWVYIERSESPKAFIWPVASRTGLQMVIDGQSYAATALDNLGKNAHGFPAAWQRCLIKKLAADLGSGPVKTIPADERQQKASEGEAALQKLMTRNQRENIQRQRFTQAWDPFNPDPGPHTRDYGEIH